MAIAMDTDYATALWLESRKQIKPLKPLAVPIQRRLQLQRMFHRSAERIIIPPRPHHLILTSYYTTKPTLTCPTILTTVTTLTNFQA